MNSIPTDSKSILIKPVKHRRILVLLGAEPSARNLLQRVKTQFDDPTNEWFALCVEPGAGSSRQAKAQFSNNLSHALRSGVKVLRLHDGSLMKGVENLVARYNLDQIIIGNFKAAGFSHLAANGLLAKRLEESGMNVEVTRIDMKNNMKYPLQFSEMKTWLPEYFTALGTVAFTAFICFLIKDILGYQSVGMIFLIVTALLSLVLGRGAIIFTALLNFVIWNFFFIPPILTFHIANYHDIVFLFANLAVAITAGILITRLRRNRADLENSRQNISLLYSLLESLNNANSIKDVVEKVRAELSRNFNADAVVYLKQKEDETRLEKKAFGNGSFLTDKEFEYASLVFDHKDRGLIQHPDPRHTIQYFPLSTQNSTLGVIGIITDPSENIDDERLIFLKSFITQITSALDREISIDIAKENQVHTESHKLFQAVLNSVSHELRTPVSVISSAISNLIDDQIARNPEKRLEICRELESSATRLNQLVENILDMSKIDTGHLQLDIQPCDVSDLVGVVMNQAKEDLALHHVKMDIPEPVPLVMIDLNWMKQALLNVVRNAASYSPSGSQIDISVTVDSGKAELAVRDQGPGIPDSAINQIFEKFYRVPGTRSGGIGIGLTVTKSLVEAHHGTVKAENVKGGGLAVTIQLPLHE